MKMNSYQMKVEIKIMFLYHWELPLEKNDWSNSAISCLTFKDKQHPINHERNMTQAGQKLEEIYIFQIKQPFLTTLLNARSTMHPLWV